MLELRAPGAAGRAGIFSAKVLTNYAAPEQAILDGIEIVTTSNNRHRIVENRLAEHIGFQPQDNTKAHRAEVETRLPAADPDAPAVRCLGGWFVNLGHPDDGVGEP